ncbi:MAG: cytochrome d ubiquinol oxidase subunit II [Rhodospirillaceae bacterium]|jgi:cytochrome bd ubiquinol oxidase subunit II|nr:cytochrome d ubiquinol oxidase subunit II [Rhodospirillaceae bacterium]MBT6202121.1 cytochrome d ubiquinol oxidase subunit II [Rhodospirillaceae bacterium]MBT6510881.1 cytochrome d ubiquinol oxidase subunit II [Rhodospirillaceae bacterium]
MDLVVMWAAILAVGVVMYVVLDGFDLGVGIVFPFQKSRDNRDRMMSSIAPVWDGNETWLVLGGVIILAIFPRAYSAILPAVYLPIFAMLLGFILRGVAFEFRHRSPGGEHIWRRVFALGSTLAAFSQGVVLGHFIGGFSFEAGVFEGGPWSWLHPFNLFTGLSLVVGYGMLGSCWLVMKTEGELRAWSRSMALRFSAFVLVAMSVISLLTPYVDPEIARCWFTWPEMLWLMPVPLLTAVAFIGLWRGLLKDNSWQPFLCGVVIFLLGFLGLAISLWPYAVPRVMTIWEAASSPASQQLLIWGALFSIPAILGYTGYTYWVFRGPVKDHDGYGQD